MQEIQISTRKDTNPGDRKTALKGLIPMNIYYYMSSFKETRDFILLSYDIHLTNDEDLLVL